MERMSGRECRARRAGVPCEQPPSWNVFLEVRRLDDPEFDEVVLSTTSCNAHLAVACHLFAQWAQRHLADRAPCDVRTRVGAWSLHEDVDGWAFELRDERPDAEAKPSAAGT
jgi:hypothetical protein